MGIFILIFLGAALGWGLISVLLIVVFKLDRSLELDLELCFFIICVRFEFMKRRGSEIFVGRNGVSPLRPRKYHGGGVGEEVGQGERKTVEKYQEGVGM